MNYNLCEVAARLKGTREYLDITAEEMAGKTKTTLADYTALENGERDFTLSFLHDCAGVFGIEMIELLTGSSPTLKKYSLVKAGKGLPIKKSACLREGFEYNHMAHLFSHKKVEPFVVVVPYCGKAECEPIATLAHEGQEMDFIISGRLKIKIGDNVEVMESGDCIYFDASIPHGMVAVDGDDCRFLAVLI